MSLRGWGHLNVPGVASVPFAMSVARRWGTDDYLVVFHSPSWKTIEMRAPVHMRP